MLSLPLKHPGLYQKLLRIRKRIYKPVCSLNAEIFKSDEPVSFNRLDRAAFAPLRPGTAWGKKYDCAWLRLTGQYAGGDENTVVMLGIRGEGLVFSADGEILDSVSTVYQLGDLPHSGGKYRCVRCEPASGGKIELFADIAYNGILLYDYGKARYHGAYVATFEPEIHAYYYDFLTLTVLLEATADKALSAKLLAALRSSYSAFSKGDLAGARALLSPALKTESDSDFVYSAVGHGHLDMAWLWPLRETRRKAARTYIKALNNIESYEGYVFGTSQPQQMLWMKRQHPSLYKKIQSAVAEGRMELQGAFWIECDTNLTGGESLVRQAVFGRQFLLEEFGKQPEDIRLCWLPDAFGFSGALPQILKKSGMDWFSTIKLAWNKVNIFPYRTFYWEGIDGSTVLVHIPPEGDYNSRGAADGLLKGISRYPEKDLDCALLVYGSGDGGGGPGETHLELILRERSLKGLPKVSFATADSFFRKLEQMEIRHRHAGELYLETHQGTYTTQGKIKYYNRLLERKLHNTEALAAFSGIDCGPQLRRCWEDILLNQFHDIIPGSSITRVNKEAVECYRTIEKELDGYFGGLLEKLPKTGEELCVLNLTSFQRNEFFKHKDVWYKAKLAPYSSAQPIPAGDFPQLAVYEDSMSNGLLTLRFDSSGEIISCVDAAGGEHTLGGLNRLVLHRDPYQFPFDAWDINQSYHKKGRRKLKAKETLSYIDGPQAVRQQTYKYRRFTIVQKVILEAESDLVRFDTKVDWHESHRMLRAEFYPVHYGSSAQCEIQFGHISRPTTEKDSVESAQFEICAHKWVATQDEGGGFALLNDSKYGHRAKNGLLSLNLLRSPTFPDKHADRGEHRFTYAFCPFGQGDLGKVIAEGYRLNNPLVETQGLVMDSFAQTDCSGIVIETIKPAEAGSGVILRLYESLGAFATTRLETKVSFSSAYETDLLENKLLPVDIAALSFSPFEIKTILLEE